MGDQNNPHAAILAILADIIPFDCLGRKAKAVRLDLNGTNVSEDLFEPLDTVFATSKQVEITCGAIRTPPHRANRVAPFKRNWLECADWLSRYRSRSIA